MPFNSLGLSTVLLRAVADQGYAAPTPIQSQAIPAVLNGRDLLAAAQTGTGKTAAFTLPLLQHLLDGAENRERLRPGRSPQVLVLVPTRELAMQVGENVRAYGKYTPLRAAIVFGGVGMQPQIDLLQQGVDILIATPGRLLDLVGKRQANLAKIGFLVLDEADRMLDMGFIHDLKRILGLLPKARQNLMFSATFSKEIYSLATGFLNNPLAIEIAPRNSPAETVNQSVYHVPRQSKQALLSRLLRSEPWGQTLVFTRTKHGANRLAEQLGRDGFRVAVIHGNKSQTQRTRALADFKQDRVQVLVATDLAARGIDIEELPHVVNYELPHAPADYVHRIGRTGRAGSTGEAVSLVSQEETSQLKSIERLLGRKLPALPSPEGYIPQTVGNSGSQDARPARQPTPRRGSTALRRRII